jgi:hypothetical protein
MWRAGGLLYIHFICRFVLGLRYLAQPVDSLGDRVQPPPNPVEPLHKGVASLGLPVDTLDDDAESLVEQVSNLKLSVHTAA